MLTRRQAKWMARWYKSALITNACEKVSTPNSRDLLLCEDEDGGMGHAFHDLYVVDLLHPADFQHNTPIAQAHAFDVACILQQQIMEPVIWAPGRIGFSVVIRTLRWEKSDGCGDLTGRDRRPPTVQRLRFEVTTAGFPKRSQ